MKNNKTPRMKVSVVEESPMGLYVWLTEDGAIVADSDGNYLNIESMKGDQRKIDLLKKTAQEYGVEGGKPTFLSGYRRVTEEEFAYQKQRMEWGLIPDELDIAAFKEEAIHLEKAKQRGQSLDES